MTTATKQSMHTHSSLAHPLNPKCSPHPSRSPLSSLSSHGVAQLDACMDTLFRLVRLQYSSDHQQQSNSSRTSTTTSSTPPNSYNNNNYYYYPQHHQEVTNNYYNYTSSNYSQFYPQYNNSSPDQEEDQEECCNNPQLFMDEDFSSTSSLANPNPNPSTSAPSLFDTAADFSAPHNLNLNLDFTYGSPHWGNDLLLECATAVAACDMQRVQQLMWMLNELASPYGDTEHKIASYFLQGLFARLTKSGPKTLRTLSSASDRTTSFDSTRRTALRFQELSPWSSFGHVAANGAILESFLDHGLTMQRLHILDLSNTFCTQWPTLLEALATRSADDTPHLTITTVVSSPFASSSAVHRVMKEIRARIEKFARLMGVPFKFNIVHHSGDLSDLDLDRLNLHENGDAAVAINCVNSLHSVSPAGRRRDSFLSAVGGLRPRIVTVVEEEADLYPSDLEEGEAFLRGFRESLRFFSAYFDSLDESFPKTSSERLSLERSAGQAVVDLVACPSAESVERRDTASGWSRRLRAAGMSPARFSDDVADDVRALLRRYREGWSMRPAAAAEETGVFLQWKEQPVVWASAWRM